MTDIPNYNNLQAIFDYKDANGNLLYQNVRFPLVAPDGSPVDIGDVAQVPYRLPDRAALVASPARKLCPE